MDWRERIVEGFPPPYRGEPASLRRDIEDELADHLALATEREMARTGDEMAAHKAAVKRFGNPRALARQLWFEAMKERIMKDRIMTVAMCLLAIAAIFAGVFAFKAFEQSRQTSQAMIAALEKLASMKQNETLVATETATATFKVVDESGKPLEGVNVSINGQPFTEKEEVIIVKTNAEGLSEFGPIKMGNYKVNVMVDQLNDHYSKKLNTPINMTLYQGQHYEDSVVIPDVPTVQVTPCIDLPSDILASPLMFVLRQSYSMKSGDNRTWSIAGKRIAVTTNNKLYEINDFQALPVSDGPDLCRLEGVRECLGQQVVIPFLKPDDAGVNIFYLEKDKLSIGSNVSELPYYRRFIIDSNDLNININKGDQAGSHEMVISFSGSKVKDISRMVVSVRDNDNHLIPDGLYENIEERIVGLRHITKDCSIMKDRGNYTEGGVDKIMYLYTKNSVCRMLVDWPVKGVTNEGVDNRKYVLAYYASTIDDAGYGSAKRSGSDPVPRIMAYRILPDWPEMTIWKTQPECENEPSAEFQFEPGPKKWKLFDVTSFMNNQNNSVQDFHGLMFRFNTEYGEDDNVKETGYTFFSRENTNPSLQPRLLIVEPDEDEGE